MNIKSILTTTLLTSTMAASAQVNITIDANQRGPKISPTHYGIFFEDINHAADGGLYAELIQNRSFENDQQRPANWQAIHNKQSNATIELTAEDPMNKAQRKSLRVIVSKADAQNLAGVTNEGFWGINAVSGRTYTLTFWAKSDKKYKGTLKAQLRSNDAIKTSLGSVEIPVKLTPKWQKYTATLTATGNDPKAAFDLLASTPGVFQLDVVSLMPPTFKNHGMRSDLAQLLADMKPAFMRFPGGCFVEGQRSPENAFRWERTIGPIEERPGHMNANWGYYTTDGLGFHEYLQLAEDIGAKPLYVVNVGIWHGGYTPLDSLKDTWLKECMDALEYANGDVSTKYGALRAKNGHPEPFNIEFVEIGNENYNFFMDSNRDQSIEYPERYKIFYDAIKAKYPNIKAIGNVESWGTDNPSWRNNYPVDIVDEHYYRNPKWFADRFHKYDTYARNSYKIYTGEYAVTSQFGTIGNLNAALGEAVYMMGMENNSDVVVMNSYAPIFVNENNAAWKPDMIRFNSAKVMCTPSYYVQKLFPNNIGTQVVKTSWTANLPEKPVENAKEEPVHIGLGSWATTATYKDVEYIVDGKNVELTDLSKWESKKGQWRARGGEVTQTSSEEAAMFICPDGFTHKKYTIKAKAQKRRGNEGFLLIFGYKNNDNYNWFNVGGWSNSQNNIEQGNGGGRIQIAKDTPFKVEDNRWYDLQVDVDGDSITAYIDGKVNATGKLQHSLMKGVYASTTIDDATKTLYIKVVNTGYGPTTGTIDLKNAQCASATLERMTSASGDDENTIDSPTYVIPRPATVNVQNNGNQLTFDVPSYSLNIIKAQLK
ncbi:MAG: carbohydrate binding domain-containing protein [Bacteroidaceae bacterium]|nr:carbohydrate binding domain-containing protein [Bacteroidaceae bacterium]